MADQPQVLSDLESQVKASDDVIDSATLLINGFAARQQAAIDKALANGATAEQLAPLTDLQTELKAKTDSLAAAVQANTPAA